MRKVILTKHPSNKEKENKKAIINIFFVLEPSFLVSSSL